jgi:sugar lactone lactonase YvrE
MCLEARKILFVSAALGLTGWALSSGTLIQKVETVNGVRLVHNEKEGRWGTTLPIKLDLIRTIGGLEEPDPNLAFNAPYDIDVDSSGNIYVLDMANNRIQKLNPYGRFLKSIGRAGQGPGDLQRAFSMDIDSQDLLYVSDAGNMRLQIISTAGKPLRQFKFGTSYAYRIRKLPSGLIVKGGGGLNLGALMQNPKKLPPLLEILELNGKVKKAFGEATDYKDAQVNSIANSLDLDIDKQGNIVLSFWYQNRIDKYSPDGELLWRADRPLNYETEVIDKGYFKRTGHGITARAPELNSVSMGIAVDAEGRIWVNTFDRQMSLEEQGAFITVNGVARTTRESKSVKMDVNKLEVFDPDGGLLGEISLSHLVHGIRIAGDSVFVWERINSIIYQYRIVER